MRVLSLSDSTPSPGVWHGEEEPPEHLALKASGAWLQEFHRNGGNRDFTLKVHTQNLTCTGPRAKAVIWQKPGLDLSAGLGGSPGEVAVAHPGDTDSGAWYIREHSSACVSSCGGWHFGTKTWPHPAVHRLKCWEALRQTTQWAGTQSNPSADRLPKDFLSSQPPLDTPLDMVLSIRGPTPSSTHQGTGTSPSHQEACTSLYTRLTYQGAVTRRKLQFRSLQTESTNTGQTLSWDQLAPGPWGMRGECTAGTQMTFPTEGQFSKVEEQNQPTTHIKTQIAIYIKWGNREICFTRINKIKPQKNN